MTDPIADMLTRIRNALSVGKREVVMPYSKFKHALAQLLQKNNWVESVAVSEEKKNGTREIIIALKYDGSGMPVINGIKRISKPGQRLYAGNQEIPRVRIGFGTTIVSTSKGLMTDQDARKEKVGGEIVCQIW